MARATLCKRHSHSIINEKNKSLKSPAFSDAARRNAVKKYVTLRKT